MSDFNLGTVTAYGYAKDKGYTGTEDEFAALMASYADVAEQAAESATQAAASATTASTKASEAAASATAAASSKTAAETAQGGAETAASTATTKAGEASASATTASGKATEATTAAGTATTKASEATTAATTATTKAGEASTSATNAAASATRAQEILDSIPEDYSQLSDDVSDLKDGLTAVESDVTDLKEDITQVIDSAYVTDTASGSIASFPDGADNVPVKSLKVNIEPVQSGSGDPSPDNVRPISGHTSAVVTVSPTTDAQDGTSYTIDLDGTRYGGTLDVITGAEESKYGIKVCNGSENWLAAPQSNALNNCYCLNMTTEKATGGTASEGARNGYVLCSHYPTPTTVPASSARADKIFNVQQWICIGWNADNANNVTAWKEYLATQYANGTPLTFVYPLLTPTTTVVTGKTVNSLYGDNNIWADTGDVDVEYRADTKLYIEKLTAPTEDDLIADHAISANTFFMVGNTLYRATTAIASGATITVGTNATRMSLSDALNTLS